MEQHPLAKRILELAAEDGGHFYKAAKYIASHLVNSDEVNEEAFAYWCTGCQDASAKHKQYAGHVDGVYMSTTSCRQHDGLETSLAHYLPSGGNAFFASQQVKNQLN